VLFARGFLTPPLPRHHLHHILLQVARPCKRPFLPILTHLAQPQRAYNKHFNPSSSTRTKQYGPSGLPPLPLPAYSANIATIFQRLATKAKNVMWTSTTPVADVPQPFNRTYDSAVAFNKAALAAATAANGGKAPLVNDLWTDFIAHCGARYKSCDLQLPANVHLTPAGIAFAAASAARDILAALA
jgi:hypothetical protein